MGFRAAVAGVALAVASSVLAAQADEPPKPLTCDFIAGRSGSYDNGVFTSRGPSPISFEITAIDYAAQSAVLGSANGSIKGKLAVARALGANHFLEIATEGFWNITTVYGLDAASGRYPAIHSRHLGLAGSPVFAQYVGWCKEK